MSADTFTDIDGGRHHCLYPEGRDPLLAAWRREQHPGWTPGPLWQHVAELAAAEQERRHRDTARQKAKRHENQRATKEHEHR